jgi:heme-degrading monooxygenase HmoA
MAVTLINPFEVPPDGDEAFVADWRRARDYLAARSAFGSAVLYRALRADVALRFINVATVDAVETWRYAVGDPGFPGTAMPFASHPALYEVVHEDGSRAGAGGTVLIDPIAVPDDGDQRIMTHWEGVRTLFAERQGYLGTRLYRSLGPADFRYVAIARWSSPLMYARSLQQPAIEEAAAAPPFRGSPALYLALDA